MAKIYGVTLPTARKDLGALEDLGIVIKKGKARQCRYELGKK